MGLVCMGLVGRHDPSASADQTTRRPRRVLSRLLGGSEQEDATRCDTKMFQPTQMGAMAREHDTPCRHDRHATRVGQRSPALVEVAAVPAIDGAQSRHHDDRQDRDHRRPKGVNPEIPQRQP